MQAIFRSFAALAMVGMLAGILLFSRNQRTSATPERTPHTVPSPGYAARDAELIETGADGFPLYTVHAAAIEQQPGADTVLLSDVNMRYRDTTGNEWTLRADQGNLVEEATRVHLRGDVRVSGKPEENMDLAQIATDSLSFDTRSEVVSTTAPVTVTWSGKRLRAQGLIANLKEHRVRLDEVHAILPR